MRLLLAAGLENIIPEPAIDWEVDDADDTVFRVRLTASIRLPGGIPARPGTPPQATKVVIQMDPAVASLLCEKLDRLIRSKGWPLP
jgi:hypothetical protein